MRGGISGALAPDVCSEFVIWDFEFVYESDDYNPVVEKVRSNK